MRARLMCPELVTVRPIARGALLVDDLAGEPYASIARSDPITLLGQVDELDRGRRTPDQGGAVVTQRFQVTYLVTDLDRVGWEPSPGDWLVGLADRNGARFRPISIYVTEVHRLGKDGKKAKLVQVQAEARAGGRAQEDRL